MKLIDFLVQELPKRGGWPDCVDSIHQDHDGEIYAWTGSSCKLLFRTGIIADNCRPYGLDESIENMVTRNQYKYALALSQKPAWNGEGVPPVGCECEWQDKNIKQWQPVKVVYASEWVTVVREINKERGDDLVEVAIENYGDDSRLKFRPLRTEAESKHEAVLESICAVLEMVAQDYKREDEAKLIYEAIAAGKIPGVKLDD